MSYFVSFPKIKGRESFFRKVSLGPSNHIVPNLTLLTVDVIWIKYVLSCLLHKCISLDNSTHINEMILNPEYGAYNRNLTWSFEYASRNLEPPPGILTAKRWNYGRKARKYNRDFFDFIEFGRFIKDILDTKDPDAFIKNAKKYSEGSISEVSKTFLMWQERFKKNVLGVNLSHFDVESFLRTVFGLLKPTHFKEQREEFVSLFISYFLKQFRETSKIEEGDTLRDHPIYHYVSFIKNELGITRKEDIIDKIGDSGKKLLSALPEPERLMPILSDQGLDAFLILKLIEENAETLFHSFVILTYLKKRKIDFKWRYVNLYKKIGTKDFQDHVRELKRALSRLEPNLTSLKLKNDLLSFLAVWWEYYQFSYIGERITREIHRYLLDGLAKDEIKRKIKKKDLEVLNHFLRNFASSPQTYIKTLKQDENKDEILLQLEEMSSDIDADAVFEYLYRLATLSSFSEYTSSPFFPSLDSFERWVDELMIVLKMM